MKCVNNVDIPEFRSAKLTESSWIIQRDSSDLTWNPKPPRTNTVVNPKRWRVPQASQVDGMSPLQRGGLLALCTCSPRAERGEAGALPTMQLDRTARVLRRCRLHMANVIIVIDTYWHGNSCLNGDTAPEMGAKTWFFLGSGHRYPSISIPRYAGLFFDWGGWMWDAGLRILCGHGCCSALEQK